MEDMAQELLNGAGYEDWIVESDSTLISPNGHCIEWDGTSPDGEESPLMAMGMI